ncbi:MAG TPA: type II toxin-antitoxin system prevent-host-death family antitoxin [Chloroflexota bacterium]
MEVTYTRARAQLAALLDRVVQDRERVTIKRRGAEEVVLIAATELRGLEEAAHLLRSPRNAARLLEALEQSLRGEAQPVALDALRREVGLGATEGS